MVELKSNEIKARMEKAIDSLKKDLGGLRVGRASSAMLDQISVNAYGSLMPLNQVSNVSVPDARMLLVTVWDNSLVSVVEKSIKESPLGLNPMVEGIAIRQTSRSAQSSVSENSFVEDSACFRDNAGKITTAIATPKMPSGNSINLSEK
jgi:ribosome recycling factor